MHRRRPFLLACAATLLLACTLSAVTSGSPQEPAAPAPAEPGAPVAPAEAATVAPPPTAQPSATSCTPQATANSSINVRGGPGTVYNEVGYMDYNQSAVIDGQNAEFTWWRIVYPPGPGGHGWVAASVVTATCTTGIAAVVPPATATVPVPIGVTGLVVSVDPKTINVPGCFGPIQQSTVVASITVNGAYDLVYHFESDQLGSLGNHNLSFATAGTKDVSEKFTPVLIAGTYWVRLHIKDVDVGGFDYQAKYKINC